ncbi:MAG: thioesterase family protein [Planctomycetota bacterium]
MPRVSIDFECVQQLPLTHSTVIPEEYLDAMGHMNVMWYTHLFGFSLGGLLQQFEIPWSKMAERHGGTFALETHVRYLSEVRVGQQVQTHARVLGRTSKRFHLLHFMTNLDKQDVSASFETITAYVDLSLRKMAAMPNELTAGLDRLMQSHDQLDWAAPVCGSMSP